MSIPFIQKWHVGLYIFKQRLRGRKRYPLVLMLEPLFRCNLACPGCGKIDYPNAILNRRLSIAECIEAAESCGAPVISIPGGEPLIHKEIGEIVAELVKRRRFVYLCTNALLLEKKLHLFKPSSYFAFSIHLDGLKEEHDRAVDRKGVFDTVCAAIRKAKAAGFRVNVNTTLFNTAQPEETADFFDFATCDLKVDGITVSPGYAYERAPDREHFLNRRQTKTLFRDLFRIGKKRGSYWQFSQSSLFLDFLAGNRDYRCSPWSNPTRNVFGWQRPCYLLNEGYAQSFQDLMESTDWSRYGTGLYEKCADCMVHCGYEGTAVADSVARPWRALVTAWQGPRTEGSMAPEIDLSLQRPAEDRHDIQVANALDNFTSRDSVEQTPKATKIVA